MSIWLRIVERVTWLPIKHSAQHLTEFGKCLIATILHFPYSPCILCRPSPLPSFFHPLFFLPSHIGRALWSLKQVAWLTQDQVGLMVVGTLPGGPVWVTRSRSLNPCIQSMSTLGLELCLALATSPPSPCDWGPTPCSQSFLMPITTYSNTHVGHVFFCGNSGPQSIDPLSLPVTLHSDL